MAARTRNAYAAERQPLEGARENREDKARVSAATVDRRTDAEDDLWRAPVHGAALRRTVVNHIGQLQLDAAVPHIELRARDEKARRDEQVPVPASLTALLGVKNTSPNGDGVS